jgi:hypothetical protein
MGWDMCMNMWKRKGMERRGSDAQCTRASATTIQRRYLGMIGCESAVHTRTSNTGSLLAAEEERKNRRRRGRRGIGKEGMREGSQSLVCEHESRSSDTRA